MDQKTIDEWEKDTPKDIPMRKKAFWNGFEKSANMSENFIHGAELLGLGILAAPGIHELHKNPKKDKMKNLAETIGLGVLALPSIAHFGKMMKPMIFKGAGYGYLAPLVGAGGGAYLSNPEDRVKGMGKGFAAGAGANAAHMLSGAVTKNPRARLLAGAAGALAGHQVGKHIVER